MTTQKASKLLELYRLQKRICFLQGGVSPPTTIASSKDLKLIAISHMQQRYHSRAKPTFRKNMSRRLQFLPETLGLKTNFMQTIPIAIRQFLCARSGV